MNQRIQTKMHWVWVTLAVVGLMLAIAPERSKAAFHSYNTSSGADLVTLLKKDGRFTTLLTAVEAAGLTETLATAEALTVLAPTDAAFAKIPADTLGSILQNKDQLTDILLYHVLAGRQSAFTLLYNSTALTLEGNPVLVLRDSGKIRINGNAVVSANLRAENGVVHAIDGVLLPPAADISLDSVIDLMRLDGRFTTLLAALSVAGLDGAVASLDELTLFAPTDEAFAKLPAGTVDMLLANPEALANILLYHVLGSKKDAFSLVRAGTAQTLQGESVSIRFELFKVRINEATVLNPNVRGPNGILHVIDSVLLPPSPEDNLLSFLEKDGRFGTLLTALEATGLDDVIATGGPFTLLAPTDAAFAKLPEGTVEALLSDPEALSNVLLYHVVAGSQSITDLLRQRSIATLQGSNVYAWIWWFNVYINRSKVIEANLSAGNGVVHAINAVLLPSH